MTVNLVTLLNLNQAYRNHHQRTVKKCTNHHIIQGSQGFFLKRLDQYSTFYHKFYDVNFLR
jgi:hypothetical protein